jgi:cytochrome c biogenesis protein CcmG/thiol:disulfide interchange protein DsbE
MTMEQDRLVTHAPAGHPAGEPQASEWRHIPSVAKRRLVVLVPLTVFATLAILFAIGLQRDPRILPSTLIGQKAPEFSLPPVKGRTLGLSSENLVGQVSLVNVFASWCVACRAEHPLLMRLAEYKTVALFGLNYKDKPDDAAQWLNTRGDPYTRTGADIDGRVGIEFGVYGVPETFVIGADGVIAYKQIGALTEESLAKTILPLVERLKSEAGSAGP